MLSWPTPFSSLLEPAQLETSPCSFSDSTSSEPGFSLNCMFQTPYYTGIFHVKLKEKNKLLITISLMEYSCACNYRDLGVNVLSCTKALSCGLLEQSESLANSPWLTVSKETKKVQISWDRNWHSCISSAHTTETISRYHHSTLSACSRAQDPSTQTHQNSPLTSGSSKCSS